MLLASGVKLPPLGESFGGINKANQGRLEGALGRIRGRFRSGQQATGRGPGSYLEQSIDPAGARAGRGIEDSLFGVLGKAGYRDTLSERDHQRKMALARELGDAASPSILEEILGGAGLAADALPGIMGGVDRFNKRRVTPLKNRPSYGSALNLFNPGEESLYG